MRRNQDTTTIAHDEFTISDLETSRQTFLDAIQDLSSAQWHFKPEPDRWSIAECAAHIALSENFLFSVVIEKAMKSPPSAERRAGVAEKNDAIMKMILDRSNKGKAPDAIDPTKHALSPEVSVQQFRQSRAHIIEYIKTTQNLGQHFLNHPDPAIGVIDACQCLLIISGHTRRHVLQILEVKTHYDFPKK